MKYRLRIRSDARNDIRSARNWYARQSAGLEARFGEELGATLSSIEERPLLYAVIYRDVRRAMTRRFPYAIYFVVDNDCISVLRVLHHARDPHEWQHLITTDADFDPLHPDNIRRTIIPESN